MENCDEHVAEAVSITLHFSMCEDAENASAISKMARAEVAIGERTYTFCPTRRVFASVSASQFVGSLSEAGRDRFAHLERHFDGPDEEEEEEERTEEHSMNAILKALTMAGDSATQVVRLKDIPEGSGGWDGAKDGVRKYKRRFAFDGFLVQSKTDDGEDECESSRARLVVCIDLKTFERSVYARISSVNVIVEDVAPILERGLQS
jgi:hypothetical protein